MGEKAVFNMISIDVTKKLKFESSSELSIKHTFKSMQISAIYGRSGAGKTTLLKIIAGLITPEKGLVVVNGKIWLDTTKKINVPVQQRNIGFVFQDHALFPNMTVKQNLLYAAGKHLDEKHIAHLLNITGLENFANIKPDALSGGQKQRTALARALVRKPLLLLLDEPLSATDEETRSELQQQLLQLQHEYKFIALLVSHNKNEVRALTDHVLQLDNGHVVKSGTPDEVFGDHMTDLNFTGTIISIADGWVEISAVGNVYKVETQNKYSIGDKVRLTFNPVIS